MKHLLRFHLKQILKLPFFWVSFWVTGLGLGAFLFLLSGNNTFINYVTEYGAFTYFEPIILIVSYGFTVYYLKMETALEAICLYTKAEIYIGKTLAIMLDSLLLCTFAVLYVCINAIVQKTGLLFTITALFHMCFLWTMMILSAESAASFICHCVKGAAAYVLCIPVTVFFSFMNRFVFFPFSSKGEASRLSAFFSIQNPFIYGANIEYAGARMDLFHIAKFFYVAVGAAVILCLLFLLLSHKKKIAAAIFSVLSLLEICCILLWLWAFPQPYDADKKLFVSTDISQGSEILGYSGNISLGEYCSVKCSVSLEPHGQENIRFRLDQCFTIGSLRVDKEELSFERDGDYVVVSLPDNMEDQIQLDFHYTGRIYYVSNVDVVSLYASRYSAALPARFALLPALDGDSANKQYDLTVTAHNTLVSNLDVDAISRNVYHVNGVSNTCSLFMGYIEEYEEDGVLFYHAKYNRLTDYRTLYAGTLNRKRLDAFTGEISEANVAKPKKVFLLYSHYKNPGFPIQYDDYLLTIGSKLF